MPVPTRYLSGCASLLTEGTADLAGVAGAVTRKAAGAAAIGLGVRSPTQDTVTAVAGPLAPGAVAPWAVRHSLPIEAGEVTVSRELGAGSFRCKGIVSSVDTRDRDKPHRAFYTAMIRRDGPEAGGVRRWATAEPAVERWGTLQ